MASSPRPFIPVPDTIETEIVFSLGGLQMANRFFFKRDFPPYDPGDHLNLALWLGDWVINRYRNVLAQNVLFEHVRARFLNSPLDDWISVPFFGYFGLWPANAMPANVTFRLRGRRSVVGSKQRPYVCVPAPPLDTVVENTFTESYWLACLAQFNRLYEPLDPFGSQWSYVSFEKDNAWRAEGFVRGMPALEPVYTVSPRRRRLRNTALYPS